MTLKKRTSPVLWDNEYAYSDGPLWKERPHHYTKLACKLASCGRVLDLGSGEGHDAIYMARHGFAVDMYDISQTALDRAKDTVGECGHQIETHCVDISRFVPSDNRYDVVLSYGFLHFIGDAYEDYISRLMRMTTKGGVHAIYTFGDVGNFHDLGSHKFWFPSRQGLQDIYAKWQVLEHDERTIRTFVTGENGEPLYNSLVKILAQKPQ